MQSVRKFWKAVHTQVLSMIIFSWWEDWGHSGILILLYFVIFL